MPAPWKNFSPIYPEDLQSFRGNACCVGRSAPQIRGHTMKTNVNWKPQGHSAKRWHGATAQKEPRPIAQTRPQKKRESPTPWK